MSEQQKPKSGIGTFKASTEVPASLMQESPDVAAMALSIRRMLLERALEPALDALARGEIQGITLNVEKWDFKNSPLAYNPERHTMPTMSVEVKAMEVLQLTKNSRKLLVEPDTQKAVVHVYEWDGTSGPVTLMLSKSYYFDAIDSDMGDGWQEYDARPDLEHIPMIVKMPYHVRSGGPSWTLGQLPLPGDASEVSLRPLAHRAQQFGGYPENKKNTVHPQLPSGLEDIQEADELAAQLTPRLEGLDRPDTSGSIGGWQLPGSCWQQGHDEIKPLTCPNCGAHWRAVKAAVEYSQAAMVEQATLENDPDLIKAHNEAVIRDTVALAEAERESREENPVAEAERNEFWRNHNPRRG